MKKFVFVFVMFLGVVFFGLGCGKLKDPNSVDNENDYYLGVNSIPYSGGSVSRSPNKEYYAAGEKVKLTAKPNSGYTFVSWSYTSWSDWSDLLGGSEKNIETISTKDTVTIIVDGKSLDANFFHHEPFNLSDSAAWEEALNIIRISGGNKTYTINVLSDIVVSGYCYYCSSNGYSGTFGDTGLTVTLQGSATISLSQSYSGYSPLSVGYGQTVIMKDLTLNWYFASVDVVGGTFNMESGKIWGGVSVVGGTFNMNDGTISGVSVNKGGTFNMDGGTISGGGVYVGNGGTFNMSDGRISGNTADRGGGVSVGDSGTFTMTGGAIWGNTAEYGGGGVYVYENAIFSKTGGLINGYDGDPVNGNRVLNCVNGSDYRYGCGHAVSVRYYENGRVIYGFKGKETSAVRYMDLYFNGITGEFSGAWDY